VDRYPFDVENFHLLPHPGLSRRSEMHPIPGPTPVDSDPTPAQRHILIPSPEKHARNPANAEGLPEDPAPRRERDEAAVPGLGSVF
jgi:hypothetical protein